MTTDQSDAPGGTGPAGDDRTTAEGGAADSTGTGAPVTGRTDPEQSGPGEPERAGATATGSPPADAAAGKPAGTTTGEPVTATAKPTAATTGGPAASPDGEPAGSTPTRPDPDRWEAFGPVPERQPTRLDRVRRRLGRFAGHEWTLAALGSLALAVLLTWPTLRYPLYTLPQDYWDPSLQSWQMAWSGHALLTDPAGLFQSNTFFPEPWSFAFSDMLLGYAPAGLIGTGPEAAVLRYNIVFVLAHALATFGAYALARQLGSGRVGAAVAGVSYTYAPWLLAQAGHLHIVSNGGIPLALAMLARGHGWSLRHGYRPERRRTGWAYAGWLVAAWQLSLGFGIGLPFAYLMAGVVLVAAVLWVARRPVFGARLLLADLIGGAVFAAVGALLSIPYFKVAELHPNAQRTIGDIAIYSPPVSGFFTAPGESRIWGSLHEGARAALPWPPEMTLLPGFVLYALALGGLFFSVWRLRHRLLLLAGVVVTMALAMGTRLFDGTFTYVPLFDHLPGWNGLRTPGRMMLWATLLLGLLAAGAVSAFGERVREIAAERPPYRPGPWLRLATLVPLLLVAVEGLNSTPHPVVPAQPAALRSVEGPLLVLPSSQNLDQPVMLWTTTKFQQVVNGGSGFTPDQLDRVRGLTLNFPDAASVQQLRDLGVRNVVLLRDQLAGTPWERVVDTPVHQLGIAREEAAGVVVFRL
ncbi:hypothetical protein [Micromonospora mirobrigensis]|uniref:4-amino-4-deoxy-L-arabinose transferase n=1 Tax=Micromonospora mirobrigensis TaxID=262898 RepID=A0A1C5ADN1_9ACTN|nr:hypothetical protein [Micromonospora mirobrigensis]SCF43313.1 hypothetical protein GA0070564_10991 [Micromonospora mirobrigensis]